MAVSTMLEPPMEALHSSNPLGDAPAPPDAWFARFKRKTASLTRRTAPQRPGTVVHQALPTVSEDSSDRVRVSENDTNGHVSAPQSSAPAGEIPQPFAKPTIGDSVHLNDINSDHASRREPEAQTSSVNLEVARPASPAQNESDGDLQLPAVTTSGENEIHSASEVDSHTMAVVDGSAHPEALVTTAPGPSAIRERIILTRQNTADRSWRSEATYVTGEGGTIVSNRDRLYEISSQRSNSPDLDSSAFNVAPPLSPPTTVSVPGRRATLLVPSKALNRANGLSLDREGSAFEDLSIARQEPASTPISTQQSRPVEQTRPRERELGGSEVSPWNKQALERLEFEKFVAPWMLTIMHNSISNLDDEAGIRLELEHIAEESATQKHFTVVIWHCGLTRKQTRDLRKTFSKPARSSGLKGFNWVIRESTSFGFRGARRQFSSAVIWEADSGSSVEIALPHNRSTLCGAPIQVRHKGVQSETEVATWTCGGLVLIDGKLFGLTTAHPFVTWRPKQPQDDGKDEEDEEDQDSVDGDNEYEADPLLWQPYQTAGLVRHFALSHTGVVPDNCDWLLFDVAQQYQLPNHVRGPAIQWLKWIHMDKEHHIRSSLPGACNIYTRYGVISATCTEESAFFLIGHSTFNTMKLNLKTPLKPGDSGAWVVVADQLIGIVIAADDATLSAFVIRIEDVMDSISTGMGGAVVELPSNLDNEILQHHRIAHGDEQLAEVIYLRVLQMLRMGNDVQTLPQSARRLEGASSDLDLSAYVSIGMLADISVGRLQRFLHQNRHNRLLSWTRRSRTVARLVKLHYGQRFAAFVAWLAAECLDGVTIEHRINYITLLVEGLCKETGVQPLNVPSTNEIRSLVDDVAFCWTPQLAAYSILSRRPPATYPLQVDVPRRIPPPDVAAQFLARLLSFDRTDSFFVYTGPYGTWLSSFIRSSDLSDVAVGSLKERITRSLERPVQDFPRVFLTQSAVHGVDHAGQYGKIVRPAELNALVRSFPRPGPKLSNDALKDVGSQAHNVDLSEKPEKPSVSSGKQKEKKLETGTLDTGTRDTGTIDQGSQRPEDTYVRSWRV